jgi:hypothetical protein
LTPENSMTKTVINIQARTAVMVVIYLVKFFIKQMRVLLLQAILGSSLLDTQAATSGTGGY